MGANGGVPSASGKSVKSTESAATRLQRAYNAVGAAQKANANQYNAEVEALRRYNQQNTSSANNLQRANAAQQQASSASAYKSIADNYTKSVRQIQQYESARQVSIPPGTGGSATSSTGVSSASGSVVKSATSLGSVASTGGKVASVAGKALGATGLAIDLVTTGGKIVGGVKDLADQLSGDPVVKAKAKIKQLGKRTWVNALPPFDRLQRDNLDRYLNDLRLRDPVTYKAIYPEVSGGLTLVEPTYPWTGGMTSGQMYVAYLDILVQVAPGVTQAYYGVSFENSGIIGSVQSVHINKIATDSRRLDWGCNAYRRSNIYSPPSPYLWNKVYYHGYGNSNIVDAKIRFIPSGGATIPDDNPPPTTPAVLSSGSGFDVSSSVLNAGGTLSYTPPSPSSSSVSLDGTSSPGARDEQTEEPGAGKFAPKGGSTIADPKAGDIIDVPSPISKGGYIYVDPPPISSDGTYSPPTESTSGSSNSTVGAYAGSDLSNFQSGGEIYFDETGTVVSKEQSAADRAGIGFSAPRTITVVTDAQGNSSLGIGSTPATRSPSASSPPQSAPPGTIGNPVPKPEEPGAKPSTPPTTAPTTPTPEPTSKFDLSKTAIDEIAIAIAGIPIIIAIKELITQNKDKTQQILDKPSSPCLAPVYVPPVGADVKKNIAVTEALSTYTATQTTAIKADTTAINTKTSAIQTIAQNTFEKVGKLTESMTKLYRFLGVDRFINWVNMALLLHNALMLSRNLGETATYAIDNIFNLVGFKIKDDNDQEITFSELVGKEFHELLVGVLGQENLTNLTSTWKKANRIYQAGANVLSSVQGLWYSGQALTAIAIENTGKIGNALRKAGQVFENAYGHLPDNVNANTKFEQQMNKVTGVLEGAENVFSGIDSVTGELQSAKDTKEQIFGNGTPENKGQIAEMKEAVNDFNDTENAKNAAGKTTSQSPEINKTDLVKPE